MTCTLTNAPRGDAHALLPVRLSGSGAEPGLLMRESYTVRLVYKYTFIGDLQVRNSSRWSEEQGWVVVGEFPRGLVKTSC